MAREIISKVCESITAMGVSSDIEEICRIAVAHEMSKQDRLLYEHEFAPIVADVVDGETVPQARVGEDGIVRVSSSEWSLIPKDSKVIDTDGEQAMVIAGTVRKVSLFEDTRASDISAKIAEDISDIWDFEDAMRGYPLDFECHHKCGPEDGFQCDSCGSFNQTPVWYDSDVCTVHCDDCDCEYDVDLCNEPCCEHCYPIIDCDEPVDGIVVYDDDGCCWGIDDCGDIVCEGDAESPEQAHMEFDRFLKCDSMIEAGLVLHDINGSNDISISKVMGRDAMLGDGRIVRKSSLAASIMLGRKIADRSHMYGFDANAGDIFCNHKGASMEVLSVDGNDVYWYDYSVSRITGDYVGRDMVASKQEFMDRVEKGGYSA